MSFYYPEVSSLSTALQRTGVHRCISSKWRDSYMLRSSLFLGDKTKLKALCTIKIPNIYIHTHAYVPVYLYTRLTLYMFPCAWKISGRDTGNTQLCLGPRPGTSPFIYTLPYFPSLFFSPISIIPIVKSLVKNILEGRQAMNGGSSKINILKHPKF